MQNEKITQMTSTKDSLYVLTNQGTMYVRINDSWITIPNPSATKINTPFNTAT